MKRQRLYSSRQVKKEGIVYVPEEKRLDKQLTALVNIVYLKDLSQMKTMVQKYVTT